MQKLERETSLRNGHRSDAFSIDSLLSNTNRTVSEPEKRASEPTNDSHSPNPFHYMKQDTDIESSDRKRLADDFAEADFRDFSQKHLNFVRHIKNIDSYLPWISPNTNFFAHSAAAGVYEDAKRIPPNGSSVVVGDIIDQSFNFSPVYTNIPIPFLYSSWLPTAAAVGANPVTKNTNSNNFEKLLTNEGTEYAYANGNNNNGYNTKTSPMGPDHSDSDDSKSDVSRISDTPKDFSCTKQRINGEFGVFDTRLECNLLMYYSPVGNLKMRG